MVAHSTEPLAVLTRERTSSPAVANSNKPKVVVIGGGFGGMMCVRAMRHANIDIKLIDRRNFHLFQPLLYQVATGGLSPANIAAPLRSIFRRQKNVQVLMGEVDRFDITNKLLILSDQSEIPFDYLVLATGSTHHYFGKDAEWESKAPGLKTVEDATEIRRRVLSAFERAERCNDPEERQALLTFVVVGGGPTGVEMAGSICELARQTMKYDFRAIDPTMARVVLIENSKLILDKYHHNLSVAAGRDLVGLGAEVWNETRLTNIGPDYVEVLQAGATKRLSTHTIIWAAGVKASPLGKKLTEALQIENGVDRGGRVVVDDHCAIPGHPNLFVIGDLAAFSVGDGKTLPGVAPVAMQQGTYVGKFLSQIAAGRSSTQPFKYWDKGNMATIGRAHAVMESGNFRLTGRLAWWAWLLIHIMYLARFENRVLVMFQWFWNYVTRNRTARLITGNEPHLPPETSN